MKEILPTPPAVVRNDTAEIEALFSRYVVPSYARFPLALVQGSGSYVWDVAGRRYLDLGGGIAVCALGHANGEIAQTLAEQARKLVHVSNLYFHEPQGRLAQQIVRFLGPGKCFFCNSGGEANEGLFKLARRFGHDQGRFEILTCHQSFHGRTLAGISATGQAKVKKGFEPMTPGFRHVPFNDLAAVESAISPATVAVLIEGIQGEGGVTPATPEFLRGLRALCDARNLLFLMDAVQCGHFRTGRFQSFQRILEPNEAGFLPDGVAMAKSLGGGFPLGAFWVREPYADLLGPGMHGTTFGGSPLGCAVALKIFEIIERDQLAIHARELGDWLMAELKGLSRQYPDVLKEIRGLGLMIGIELQAEIPRLTDTKKSVALQMVQLLHEAGVLTVPAGAQVLRWLPPLNLQRSEAEAGLEIFASLCRRLSGGAKNL